MWKIPENRVLSFEIHSLWQRNISKMNVSWIKESWGEGHSPITFGKNLWWRLVSFDPSWKSVLLECYGWWACGWRRCLKQRVQLYKQASGRIRHLLVFMKLGVWSLFLCLPEALPGRELQWCLTEKSRLAAPARELAYFLGQANRTLQPLLPFPCPRCTD